MYERTIRKIAVIFAVLVFAGVCIQPACAAWETGINFVSSDKTDTSQQSFDTQEAYIDETVRLINAERVAYGLSSLEEMDSLRKVSDIRAQEASVSFSHQRPNGTSCSTVFCENELPYSSAGENLAYGYDTPSDLVKAWMDSKLHRKNILNKKFVYAEIGYFENDNGVIYCALLLYTPKEK